jgi:hypothetical protein
MKPLVFIRYATIALGLMIVVSQLTSCADVTNVDACRQFEPYGFWGGLWHGLIAPVSFFGSLLSDDIAMYAVNNNGGWYDLGFVVGAGILFSGGNRASRKRF